MACWSSRITLSPSANEGSNLNLAPFTKDVAQSLIDRPTNSVSSPIIKSE